MSDLLTVPPSIPTSITRSVPVTTVTEAPVSFSVRPSRRNPDTIVVTLAVPGEGTRRVALLRLTDGGTGVTIRTLDGNPREKSSTDNTQTVISVSVADLTEEVEG